jgi:hypothetical protein
MNHRARKPWLLVLSIGLGLVLARCSSNPSRSGAEDTGQAVAEIVSVPPGVSCIRITVVGKGTVTRLFDVTPMQGATLPLNGLPLGTDTFVGDAFPVACSAIATSVPSWVASPVVATIAAGARFNVVLVFVPNTHGTVTTEFDAGAGEGGLPNTVCDDGGCACAPGFDNCDGTFSNGCEANLSSDPANCGACGNACSGGACVAGACQAPAGGADAASGDGSSGGDAATSSSDRFPATSTLYQNVSSAALDPNSASTVNLLNSLGWGPGRPLRIDFSFTILHASSSVVPRVFTEGPSYPVPDCDTTPVPIPPGGNAEGISDYNCDATSEDCQVLVYQGTRLYELYQASIAGGQATGSPFTVGCEVVWDLTHDYWQPGTTPFSRGDQCVSTDVAGMPIAPLLVTGAELQAGVIPHALRFTLPTNWIQKAVYVHPGTHTSTAYAANALLPPIGTRFRLRASFPVSTLPSAGAKAIAVALQTYGMFLDDAGSPFIEVDSTALGMVTANDLITLLANDFEVVASPDPPVTLTGACTRTPLTQ